MLIWQWIQEINQIVFNQFIIYFYYEDKRSGRNIFFDVKIINEMFIRKHEIFNDKKQNVKVIVIFVYITFAERNESKAQNIWKKNKRHFNSKKIENTETELNLLWVDNISKEFNILVCDECHMIKNSAVKASIALQWIKARFNILMSIIIMFNELSDFKDYWSFLKMKHSAFWWTFVSLHNMFIDADENFYKLFDDHSAVKLRLTAQIAKKYIHKNNYFDVIKELWLSKILKHVLLRRINASTVFFKNDRRIKNSLSAIKTVILNCVFNAAKVIQHKIIKNDLTDNLLISDTEENIKKKKYFLCIHRQLQLAFMSIKLQQLNEHFDLKIDVMKILFFRNDYHLNWIRHLHSKTNFVATWSHNFMKQIKLLIKDASKMKTLLKNVRD